MHPSQALETWWNCTNPMPEVAGLQAVVERLLALPEAELSAARRAFLTRLNMPMFAPQSITTEPGRGS